MFCDQKHQKRQKMKSHFFNRVFVTNAIGYLPECDRIFVMKDGKISEQVRLDEEATS